MFSDFTFDVNEIKLCQISLKKKTNFIVLRLICKSLIVDNYLKKKANIGENILGILSAVQCILIYLNKLLLKNSAHICRKNWGKNHESYSGIMKCKLIRYRCNVFVLPSNHKI